LKHIAEMEVQLNASLTLSLDGGVWSALRPFAYPRKTSPRCSRDGRAAWAPKPYSTWRKGQDIPTSAKNEPSFSRP